MKTILLVVSTLLASSTSFAAKCPAQWGDETFNEKIAAAVQKAPDCASSAAIVRSCAMGNSNDALVFSTAEEKCSKVFSKIPKERALFKSIANRCQKKYANASGTMYLSMEANCRLEAAQLIADVNTPVENE